MRSLLPAIAATVALLWLATDPWYQHLPWPLRAAIVLGATVFGVLGALAGTTLGRVSRGGQEDQ